MKEHTIYVLVDEEGLYVRRSYKKGGARSAWERPQDVAVSYTFNKHLSSKEYKQKKAEGKIKIFPITIKTT